MLDEAFVDGAAYREGSGHERAAQAARIASAHRSVQPWRAGGTVVAPAGGRPLHSRRGSRRRAWRERMVLLLVAGALAGAWAGGLLPSLGAVGSATVDARLSGVGAPAPGEEPAASQRLLSAPPVPTSESGGFAFLHAAEDGRSPVRWDPCRPVRYVVRPAVRPRAGRRCWAARSPRSVPRRALAWSTAGSPRSDRVHSGSPTSRSGTAAAGRRFWSCGQTRPSPRSWPGTSPGTPSRSATPGRAAAALRQRAGRAGRAAAQPAAGQARGCRAGPWGRAARAHAPSRAGSRRRPQPADEPDRRTGWTGRVPGRRPARAGPGRCWRLPVRCGHSRSASQSAPHHRDESSERATGTPV